MRTSGNSVVRWSDQSSSVGTLAGQRGELAGEKIAERSAGDVDVVAVAVDEVHRHVEGIVDIALEAHAGLEHERQHARAAAVGVAPHLAAHRHEAVRLAFGERRAGEDRGRDRLQRQRHAQLLDHVGLVAEVQVHLDRRRAVHHVEAALADLRHVARHHRVAPLGHARRLVERPRRREADAEEADAQILADGAHLLEVRLRLLADLVHVGERRARQLELPAGLQRHGRRRVAVRPPAAR